MLSIYMVHNKINNKIYIGKTSRTLAERWKWHIQDSNKNRLKDIHFYRAIRKYGPASFNIWKIDGAETEPACNELEKTYIQVFKSYLPEIGYNGTMGGEGGRQTAEIRKKMGESRRGANNPFYGKKHSPESIEKNRAAHIGKPGPLGVKRSDETKRKISESHKGLLVGAKNPNFGGLSDSHKQHIREARLKYFKKLKEKLCLETIS
jgi:hypothetical protein